MFLKSRTFLVASAVLVMSALAAIMASGSRMDEVLRSDAARRAVVRSHGTEIKCSSRNFPMTWRSDGVSLGNERTSASTIVGRSSGVPDCFHVVSVATSCASPLRYPMMIFASMVILLSSTQPEREHHALQEPCGAVARDPLPASNLPEVSFLPWWEFWWLSCSNYIMV